MRYSSTHKEEIRNKLLANSRAIAKRGGFESTGVDALMKAIGLTGAAFYNHFPSKQALFQSLIEAEIDHSAEMLAGVQNASDDPVLQSLHRYLSAYHVDHPEQGCVLPTLGPEIARAAPEVRKAVESGLKRIHHYLSDQVGESDAAWALIAQCVGALILARSMESDEARRDILHACRRTVDDLYQIRKNRSKAPPSVDS